MSLLIYLYIHCNRNKQNKIYFHDGRILEIVGNLVGVPGYQEGAAN